MKQIPNGPSGWLAYVEVDDIRAATKKAKSLGGEVMKDVTEVSGMGWLSFIRDPTGACSRTVAVQIEVKPRPTTSQDRRYGDRKPSRGAPAPNEPRRFVSHLM